MISPKWFRNLFMGQETQVDENSTSLNKKANQSELIQNILMDKPVETSTVDTVPVEVLDQVAEASTKEEKVSLISELEKTSDETKKCPECDKPNQFGELCDKCTRAEASNTPKVEKQAGAYELGETEAQTSAKGHESQIKIASDFALAEMLTEFRLKDQGVQERWHIEFPKCLGEVKKDRKACEKELLAEVPLPAVIDRMKFLNEVMTESHEKGFKPTETKNLYSPLFEQEGKQTWDKASDIWKEKAPSKEEQYKNQMTEEGGPGREEKDQMEHQAPRSTTAGAHDKDDIQLIPQNKYLVRYHKIKGGEEYYMWFETKEAADQAAKNLKEKEFAVDPKVKDYSKDFEVKEGKTIQKGAELSKEADIASPWTVVKEGETEVIARITPEEVLKKSKEKSEGSNKKASLDIVALANKILAEMESKAKLAITAAEALPEPAESLEGLNPQEQALWKEYYKLAFSWASADPISRKIGVSETRRAAMMALLRAIRSWNPEHESKAKFSSYLYTAIHNELLTALKQSKGPQPEDVEFVPLDKPISEGDRMYESETLQDLIEDVQQATPEEELEKLQDEDIKMATLRKAIEKTRQALSGKAKEVFELLAQGYNISEVAELLHYTIPNIVRYRKQIIPTLEKALVEAMSEVLEAPPEVKYKEPEEVEVPEENETPA